MPMLKLRNEQWERIREHFSEENISASRPGRKPIPACRVDEVLKKGIARTLTP